MALSTKKLRKPKSGMAVSYLERQTVDPDGFITPVFSSIRTSKRCVKRYCNHMHLLANLSPSTRLLLDYITEKMDEENRIQNTKILRNDLLQLLNTHCGQDYKSDHFIHKGFRELKKEGILLHDDSVEQKGIYTVNPKHYFRGSERSRQKLLTRSLSRIRKMKGKNNYKKLLE